MKRLTLVVLTVAALATLGMPLANAQRHRGKPRAQKSFSQQSKQPSRSHHRHYRSGKPKHRGFQYHHAGRKISRKTKTTLHSKVVKPQPTRPRPTVTMPHQTGGKPRPTHSRPAVTMPHATAGKPRPTRPRPDVTMPHQTVSRPSVTMPLETAGRPRPANRPRPGSGPPRPRRDYPVQGTQPVYVPWAGNWRSAQ